MPAGAFVMGIDSHTALVLDLDRATATVSGLGGLTIRADGRSTRFPGGTEIAIGALDEVVRRLVAGDPIDDVRAAAAAADRDPATRPAVPLRDEMTDLEGAFIGALERDEVREAVVALLELDTVIAGRVRAGEDSPDLDNAGATFRSLIVRLGERAATGARDPRPALDPFVTALLDLREAARARQDWATADLIRDRLGAAGVEIRDAPGGSTWRLPGSTPDPAG